MIPVIETKIIHSIEPDSKSVKTLYEVFSWGQEATGEYLFFGEINKDSVKDDGTGDLSKFKIRASVDVSFETDVFDVAKDQIERSKYYNLAPLFETLVNESPVSVIDNFGNVDAELLIERGENFCSLFSVDAYFNNVYFKNIGVIKDRVTTVLVVGNGNENTIDWLQNKFFFLVNKYKDIPYNVFTGAIRE